MLVFDLRLLLAFFKIFERPAEPVNRFWLLLRPFYFKFQAETQVVFYLLYYSILFHFYKQSSATLRTGIVLIVKRLVFYAHSKVRIIKLGVILFETGHEFFYSRTPFKILAGFLIFYSSDRCLYRLCYHLHS
jgi:hypothetical protein